MNLNKSSRILVLFAALALVMTGCSSNKPRAWNVTLTKSTPATIKVDLVGVRAGDKPEWQGRNITEYWAPGSPVREEADKITFSLEMGKVETLKLTDPKWTQWLNHGTHELMIIANLPGEFPPGANDPRRKFLPLRAKDWDPDKKNTIEIEIKQTGIRVQTRQLLPE